MKVPMNMNWVISLLMGLLLLSTPTKSQTLTRLAEICDNGIDDDGDGLLDGFDPDCIGIGTNCSGYFGDNLFQKGDFGTTADGRNPTQPNPASNGSMVLGNLLPASTTSYSFGFNLSEGCPDGRNCWINDGAYIIATNTFGMLNPPNTNWNAWQRIHDNSGRTDGYMMIVNAGLQPDIFFKQTINNLCPNTTYYFSIDVTNLFLKSYTAIHPDISFVMAPEGTSLATLKTQPALYSTGDIPQDEQWHSYGFAFVTPPDVTSAEFAIRNNNPGGFGNDLCLDNIRLRPCFPNIDLKVNKNLLCANENLTLTVQTGSRLKYFYQWQFSSDGGNTWQDLTGKTDDICTISNFQRAHEGLYRVIASPNPTANCRYTSPPVTVKLAPPVSVSIRGNPQFCTGDSLVLDASGDFQGYKWSNGANTATISIKQGGNYAVTVTDRNGCVGQTAFQTTVLPFTAPNLKGNAQFCLGDSTILEVQGDFQSFSWSNGEISPKITVKQSGNYSVTVTDTHGCKGQAGMQITVTPSLLPAIKGTLQFCTGDSSVLEIEGDFQNYTWSNGEKTAKITVKQGGTYTATVTDRNGCKGQAFVEVTHPPSVLATIKGNTEFCTGDSTVLEVQGDFQSFVWSNGEISPRITVKQSGDYAVTVTDKNGCKSQTQVKTTVAASLAVVIKGNPQFCLSDSTILEVQGDFQSFSWSTAEISPKITVKQSGNYAVTVVDKSGCKGQSSVQVSIPPSVIPTIKGNLQFCSGDSTVLEVQGDFQNFLWSNGAKTAKITVKSSGNYAVSATDKNGCKVESSTQVTMTPSVNTTIKGNTSFCTGDNTMLEIEGNFQKYEWSNGEKTPKITVNQAGNFSVTVTDRNGCIGQAAVETKVSPSLFVAIKGTLQFCTGDTVTLTTDGSFDNYSWSNGENTAFIKVSQSGDYAVSVTDKNGCKGQTTAKTLAFPAPTTSIRGTPQFCSGDSTILEAQGNFTQYAWSNGANTSTIKVFDTKAYRVTATDANGCKAQATLQTTAYTNLPVSIRGKPEFCTGDSTILEAQGNFTAYKWSNGSNNARIKVFDSNNYRLTVTDRNGCKGESQFQTTAYPPLKVVIEGKLAFCTGESTDLKTNSDFKQYEWSNGEKTSVIQVKDARKYAVSVTDLNGCKGETAVQTKLFPSVQTTFKIENPTCAGATNGQIKVNIETGTPPYSFQWQQGANTPLLTHLKAGQYVLTVRDSALCSHHDTLTLFEPEPIQAQTRMISPNCYGETLGKIQFDNIAGGTGGFNIAWNNSRFDTVKTLPLVKDSMRLGSHFFTVKDRNGCLFADSLGVYNIRIQLSLKLGNDQVVLLGDNLTLSPLPNFKPATFQWHAEDDSLKCPRCWDIDIQPLKKYNTYILRAKDSLNCPVSDTLNVRVQNLKRVFIPTAFSPNDDNMNDFFTIFGAKEVSQIAVFKIFDRWGELVWETQNLQPNVERLGWDGDFKGMRLSPAVYVYYALVEFVNGEREVFAGDVTLMK